jgi:hypothetical protein
MKTLKGFCIVLFLFVTQSFVAEDETYIYWDEDIKLRWMDFSGSIPAASKFSASTRYGIKYDYATSGDTINVKIRSYFIPEESWVKPGREKPALLNHEQRHFDIAEINARKFRQYVSGWHGKNKFGPYIEAAFDSCWEKGEEMQKKYDRETSHSKNKIVQKQWNQRIDSLLDAYKEFKSPDLKVRRRK